MTLPLVGATACSYSSAIQTAQQYVTAENCFYGLAGLGVLLAVDTVAHRFNVEEMYAWKVFDIFK